LKTPKWVTDKKIGARLLRARRDHLRRENI